MGDKGEEGVKNLKKLGDFIYGQPHTTNKNSTNHFKVSNALWGMNYYVPKAL